MKKNLGVNPYVFPMPVLMIATYGEDDKVDVVNMAWGGICAENMVALNIDENHKTAKNIKAKGAFTLSIADVEHIEEADFFGIASGNSRNKITNAKPAGVTGPVRVDYTNSVCIYDCVSCSAVCPTRPKAISVKGIEQEIR